jgi:SAM-dependent methyltransferase
MNHGYLSGILMRDAQVSRYVGVDLYPRYLKSVAEMRAVNGLEHVPCQLERQDLYALTPEWMAARRPDLVLLVEVLEHVPDAERALEILTRCLHPGAGIVFSVPALGRLESCWQHVSLFDAARVRRMLTRAGLIPHHVEVVYDTWVLVVASATEDLPPRVVQLLERTPPLAAPAIAGIGRFVPLDLSRARRSRWHQRTRRVEVTHDDDGVHCLAHGCRTRLGAQYAGLTLDVPAGATTLRLEILSGTPKMIRRVFVEYADRNGKGLCRWTWNCGPDDRMPDRAATYVLRPGRASGPFHTTGGADGPTQAVTADIVVEIEPGSSSTFTVCRAAAVDPAGGPDQ